ncbi:putative lipopolysaccharide heptosyltransferase III [Thioflexithrix psekupsensis]|uniref:Putative lipopolysaccharide heptosyltransferase III n=1 Tax=Thioflexithrix psekupsensis TaxID=1570016 RepID=A0A251XB76_9GAMM|nr:putative lipopolysaccharide heptosyltransferase III [Thioflexithrix psekupsensis]OUD15046.1 putative lipopolysaccharide heptosyltransferase III [Thioflexithrix psekupsensis]
MAIYPAEHILVIATRQIGDVLLTTPLLRTLRKAYPTAKIDMLVFQGKAGIIEGNPDINKVITIAERPGWCEHWHLFKKITRRYDVAVITLTGDKPALYGFLAAPKRIAVVPPLSWKSKWKHWLATASTVLDDVNTHTVIQNLRLADLLGIPRCYQVVLPENTGVSARLSAKLPFNWLQTPYVVLHLMPMWRYKCWTLRGWGALAHYLHALGLEVVLTGSQAPAEQLYIQQAMQMMPRAVVNMAGRLNFAEVAALIRRSQAYVGPDTAVTHLAAATGVPTVAIFGPTNPVKWGPWPAHYARDANPYRRVGTQFIGNVALVQGEGDCVPCHLEGCERHRYSRSECLDKLTVEQVQYALEYLCNQNIYLMIANHR